MDLTPAEALHIRAKRAGVSMYKLCRDNGIDPSTPSRWLSGKMNVGMASLIVLTEALEKIEASR